MEYEKTTEPFTSDITPMTFEQLLSYYTTKFSTRSTEKHNKDDERVARKVRGSSSSISISSDEEIENDDDAIVISADAE